MLSFGERLRIARERAGLSQLDVFRAINLNNKSLSRYENNATSPDPETIKALVSLYGVSADFILGLSDEVGSSCSSASQNPSHGSSSLEGLSPEAKEKAKEYIEMLKTLEAVKSGPGVMDLEKEG